MRILERFCGVVLQWRFRIAIVIADVWIHHTNATTFDFFFFFFYGNLGIPTLSISQSEVI